MNKLLSSVCLSMLLVSACSEDDEPGSTTAGAGGTRTGVAGAAGAPAGTGGTAGAGGGSAGTGGTAVSVQRPNPIISRSATTFSQPAGGNLVVDGNYHSNGWYIPTVSAEAPAWVAIQLTQGPTRLLLSWDDGGTYNYQDLPGVTVYGLPGAYHVDVSADSTNGQDGTWDTVASVEANAVRTRAHAFDFTGKSWVKLVVTAAPPTGNNGAVSIGEIDVHDISATATGLPEDTWFFMGDSITAFAYDRATVHQPSFAAGINAAVPGYFPAMINGGIGGETTTEALIRLADTLARNPDYRFVILGYGTNDAANRQVQVATFKANLQTMIDQIKAAGREPVIPHIPLSEDGQHAAIPEYNTAIDELTSANDLVAGADLYGFTSTTPDLFTCPPCGGGRMTDNLHPNDTGLQGFNAEWSEAMRNLYPQ
jgi:acyl-CoA thioesterase I